MVGVQGRQEAREEMPRAPEKKPEGQRVQLVLPSVSLYVPAPQGGQEASPVALLNAPAEQRVQVALLLAPVAADAVPGGHSRHCVTLVAPRAADHVPLGQGVHSDVLACAANVPRGHRLHTVALATEKFPGAQARQEEEPGKGW